MVEKLILYLNNYLSLLRSVMSWMLQNYWKDFKECFFGTTCTMIYVTFFFNLQSHNDELPVEKALSLLLVIPESLPLVKVSNKCQFIQDLLSMFRYLLFSQEVFFYFRPIVCICKELVVNRETNYMKVIFSEIVYWWKLQLHQ